MTPPGPHRRSFVILGGAALLASLAIGSAAFATPESTPTAPSAARAMDPADAPWCERSRQRLDRMHRRLLRQRGMPSIGQAADMQRLRIQRERRCPEAS